VNVSAGATIAVVNRADAPGATVGRSGTLAGSGDLQLGGTTSLSETARVYGTLAPAGALTIEGNLDLTAGNNNTANAVFHVTPTASDSIQVSQITGGGNATLGGRVTVIITGTFTYFPRSFTLLHADAGLGTTTFAYESITAPGCISAAINYDANNVNLVLTSSCD
jgi:hypothetical protein